MSRLNSSNFKVMPNKTKIEPKPILYVKSFNRFRVSELERIHNNSNSDINRNYEFKAPRRIFKFDEELLLESK